MSESQQNIIGQIIAERWQITEFLGEGYISYVYKAQDVETGKIIVLKLIKNSLLPDSADLKILEQQARNFLALNHENIANYYNLYLSTDDRLFLFCDYLQGQNLAAWLGKAGKLSIEQSIQIFKQISTGLCYAHEKKIWHGDLRPSNVFIVNDQFTIDEAKIVDFGLLSLIESLQDKKSTFSIRTTVIAPYLSPEQKTGQNIDQRCDLYALGCLMYETLTGKPPYVGTNAMATAYKQKQQTTIALDNIVPAHPMLSRYQTIVSKLLKANRQERYQSAFDLKADLDLISHASDSEWSKKVNALKQSTYSKITTNCWPILIVILAITLLTVIAVKTIDTIGPYYQPWTSTAYFDDSKLWLVQERQILNPSIDLIKHKYLLAGKLASLKKNKQESSQDYIQTLFAYSRVLLGCGQWQDAQAALVELQKKDLKNSEVRSVDISAHLALVYFMLSNLSAVEDYSNRVLSTAGQGLSLVDNKIIVLKILGDLYTSRNEDKKALATYEQLHKLTWESHLRHPSDYAYACALLADAYRKDKQYTQAEKLYKEAIDWGINFIGQKQLFMAKVFYGLALTQYKLGELAQAENQLQQALPIAIAHLGQKNKFVIALKSFNDYLLFHQNLLVWAKQHWQ